MPVIVENKAFFDAVLNSTNFYRSNAGDPCSLEMTFSGKIRLTSINNPLSKDPTLSVVTSPTINWEEEGFRTNDYVLIVQRDSSGNQITNYVAQITSISGQQANFNSLGGLWYDITANEILEFIAVTDITGTTARKRDTLEFHLNHSLNSQAGNEASLIDGEASVVLFENVSSMTSGQTITGSLVGNQSGQFLQTAELTYNGLNADFFDQYTLNVEFINSGVYNQEWFDLSDCLKFYVKGYWSSLTNEPFNRTEFELDDQANTGWYNEANNTSIISSGSIVAPITELDYSQSKNYTFRFDGNLADCGIGSCYISIDDAYYKNKITPQTDLTMIVPTGSLTIGTKSSYINPEGAQYDLIINSITNISGTLYEVDLTFTPNADFIQMFEDLEEDNRLFYIWLRIGNVNHLIFEDQLTKEVPTGGTLNLETEYAFLDHSQNVDTITGSFNDFKADTEDDIAYYGTFLLDNNVVYDSLQCVVQAKNVSTNEDFTLQQTNFDFGSVSINSGKYLLNETQAINTDLLETSAKINAIFKREASIDTSTQYGVSIYYPILLNWKYWLDQNNANTDFYPNQNQNWQQYSDSGFWQLQFKLTLVQNGLGYTREVQIVDNAYDNSADITSSIALKKQSDNSVVTIIPEGEQLFIESTHVKLSGNWSFQKVWGNITIEPKESAPRWQLSTIVPYDNNLNNPLQPISGSLISVIFTAPDTVVFKCKFDPAKINLDNGVKITAKIKEGCESVADVPKTTTYDAEKETTTDDIKTLS